MKIISSFKFIISFMLFASGLAQSSDLWNVVSSSLDEIRRDSAEKTDSILKHKVKKIQQSADSSARELESGVVSDVNQIKKSLKDEIEEVQADTDQEIQEIVLDAKQVLDSTKFDYSSKIKKMHKDVATKILSLVRDAEEIAFKLGRDKQDKMIIDKLLETLENTRVEIVNFEDLGGSAFQIPVPSYWKKQVAHEFYKNSAMLEQIVLDAENGDQVNEFINCFKEQKLWFDKTLSATKYTSDPGYSQIVNKKMSLDHMTLAVKKAEAYLRDWTELLSLSDKELNKIKLLFLYEVNSEMQRLRNLPVALKHFADDEIRLLTLKFAQDVTGRAADAFPDVDFMGLQASMVPSDMKFISQINQDLSDLKSAMNKKDFEIKSIDEYLKKLNSDLVELSVQIINDGQTKNDLRNIVGDLEKDVYEKIAQAKTQEREFSEKILSKDNELTNLNFEMGQTKRLLNELKLQNAEAKNKLEFIESLTNRKMDEHVNALKTKVISSSGSNLSKQADEQERLNKRILESELENKKMFK